MANDGTVKIGVEFDENDFNKEAKKQGGGYYGQR